MFGSDGTRWAYLIGAGGYVVLTFFASILPLSWGFWTPLAGVFMIVSSTVWIAAPPGWGTKIAHELAAFGLGLILTPLVIYLFLFFSPFG